MLSDETFDKAPADLVSPCFAATAAIHAGIYTLRESPEFDESRAVPVDVESIRNAVAGWQSEADRAAGNCYKLAHDLHEFGHYFVGVNSGPVSITVPLGGELVGGPWEADDLAWFDNYECEWSRVGTAPSWHHAALGVARLFLAEIQPALWRLEDVLKRHTAGGDRSTAHVVECEYYRLVGNERRLPITLRWRESDLTRLHLNLEQELLRAWGTWFPAGSEYTAFGDWPEEAQEQAKSGYRRNVSLKQEKRIAEAIRSLQRGARQTEVAEKADCSNRTVRDSKAWARRWVIWPSADAADVDEDAVLDMRDFVVGKIDILHPKTQTRVRRLMASDDTLGQLMAGLIQTAKALEREGKYLAELEDSHVKDAIRQAAEEVTNRPK